MFLLTPACKGKCEHVYKEALDVLQTYMYAIFKITDKKQGCFCLLHNNKEKQCFQ